MYIRRVKGPYSVTLPDGSEMTRADLPSPTTNRWVASRKAAIVRAVEFGLIDHEEACATYGLSAEELDAWSRAVSQHGEGALKATAVQQFRD
ncbi:CtrA inhibitor SciP [Alterinioella nitratireducens]|uniref:CtrA inhibitor SciP n=1 Tax=Alterinioella nitratireducens TaxID=2735915 RepID=UPI0015575C8D|nr:DUF1153 domain-containing protein [Alterinioella nitratireducens]NPD21364.1 DUF1153 domain-containing protein [Alterinioella nitratireducens]